jgi:hypothetical protein
MVGRRRVAMNLDRNDELNEAFKRGGGGGGGGVVGVWWRRPIPIYPEGTWKGPRFTTQYLTLTLHPE